MPGPHPAVALTRFAIRHVLRDLFAGPAPDVAQRSIIVGVSGGADSMALAAALAFEAPKLDAYVEAVCVDHGLQPGSDVVAENAATLCRDRLGIAARVVRVAVAEEPSGMGLEAAARSARYRALRDVTEQRRARAIVVGHTGDDQAEQVLLGLMRGSGARSLAGMRVWNDDVLRPFLLGPPTLASGPVLREHTQAACAALGLPTWDDPHNENSAFARVRARNLLRELETGLDTSSLRRSLMRTAESLGRDTDLLDRLTDDALAGIAGARDPQEWPKTWPAKALARLDPALRIRAIRRLALLSGAPGSELTAHHLYEVERLLLVWRGQGPLDLPGHVKVTRTGGEVAIMQYGRHNE